MCANGSAGGPLLACQPRAALERKESRGAHTREDFGNAEAEWGKVNVVVRSTDSGMEVTHAPLPEMPDELKKVLKGE